MDFNRQIIHPLPFFMTHPGYPGLAWTGAALQDLEYLQQTYPKEVKRYQRRIAEILDKMDYEGSMIYDEYPDCYSIRRMADTIINILRQEETDAAEGERTAQEWKVARDMVQVLLCNEIYKRRHTHYKLRL